jgi:hypothetical protein
MVRVSERMLGAVFLEEAWAMVRSPVPEIGERVDAPAVARKSKAVRSVSAISRTSVHCQGDRFIPILLFVWSEVKCTRSSLVTDRLSQNPHLAVIPQREFVGLGLYGGTVQVYVASDETVLDACGDIPYGAVLQHYAVLDFAVLQQDVMG